MEFNPYCEWLAIPPSCLPPSHYRLLGLKDFESDGNKIHQAALSQIARLRVHQAGVHSDLTQKMMNEVSLARVTLCDAGKKEEYDRLLRAAVPRAVHVPRLDPNEDELLSDDSVEGSSEWELDPENSGQPKSWRTGPIKTVFGVSVATVAFLALIAMALIVGLRRNAATSSNPHAPPPPEVGVESATIPVTPPATLPATPLPPAQPSLPVVTQGAVPTPQSPATNPTVPDPAATIPPVVESAPEPVEPPPEEVAAPLPKPKANDSLEIIRQWSGPFDEPPWKPGVVNPIPRANTSADESFPVLANDGLDLYFTRRTGRGDEIFCLRRSSPESPFQQEARLKMPTAEPLNTSASFSADGTCLLFGREKDGQNIMLQSVRPTGTSPFAAEQKLEFENVLNPQGDPFLTADGLHLVMSAGQGKYARVWRADRPAISGDFPEPHALELEGSYRRPSITGDLCTIYMEGQLPDGRSAIYRSMRQSVSSPWSPPLIVKEIRSTDDSGSDTSPRINNDGTLLLFASTRTGTSGGKDLYAYPLDKPPTVTWPEEDSAEAPSPPPVDGWMVLGPIPMDVVERISSLTELAKKYFPARERRDVPNMGDKIAETPWRIADSISGKAGLYLMVFPFEMESTADVIVDVWPPPGGVMLWLDNKEILALGERKPWSKTGWKKTDCQSSPTQIRKGKHRLYALICAPNDGSTVSIDFRFADTNKPVGKMLQLLPAEAPAKDR